MAIVALPTSQETPSKLVWPSIGAFGLGRLVGRLCAIRLGLGNLLTLGKLFALLTIPLSLSLYLWKAMPGLIRRYRLTDRRLIVQRGLSQRLERSIGLDEFDAIEIRVLPGQQWLHCGELVFLRDGQEVFHLSGVPRPEVFRQICLKQRNSLQSIRQLLRQQAPDAA